MAALPGAIVGYGYHGTVQNDGSRRKITGLNCIKFSFYSNPSRGCKTVAPVMEGIMPQDSITFKEVAEKYLTLSNNGIDKSWHERVKKTLESRILPRWQHMPIVDITRAHGAQLLQDVLAQRPSQAFTVESVIRFIFNFALREGHIKANPMLGFIEIVFDEPMPSPTPSLSRPSFGL